MNHRSSYLLWLLLTPAAALAAPSVTVETGYRVDRLQWSIAGPNRSPDILSELSWEDLQIAQLSVRGEFGAWGPVLLRAEGSYGYAYSGSVQDSDYFGSGRTNEVSRSNSSAEGSEVFDLSVAAGFPLTFAGPRWQTRLTPLAGLSYHRQDLRLRHGVQTVSVDVPPDFYPTEPGPFEGLDSRYAANWAGPWIGAELRSRHRSGWGLMLRADYHFWAAYLGEADWNLRTELEHPVSFRQRTDGRGVSVALGLEYAPSHSRWSWQLRADWQRWRTQPGEDTVYFADGEAVTTRFNGADWDSSAISLGGRYRF